MENQWLSEAQLTRAYLNSLISEQKQEHPQAKYIYMEAEESTKKMFEHASWICNLSNFNSDVVPIFRNMQYVYKRTGLYEGDRTQISRIVQNKN